MVDIGFGAIMGRQQLDRPRREIEDLKPDVDQRRADRGAQYIGQPRIGERRADKLMGAQYLESLALQERGRGRSEEHTSELQSLMRISYAVFCLKKKKRKQEINKTINCIRTQTNLQAIKV